MNILDIAAEYLDIDPEYPFFSEQAENTLKKKKSGINRNFFAARKIF